MNAPHAIPHNVLALQRVASDPSVSAWVSANAGSGKTHVLAQRVIRLLLQGTDPAKILCLTFTKAAAANMANRVFTTLAKWITLDDRELDQAIREVGADGGSERRALARRLFACALETPGGLKIQTIHGFCARLLQQFPFEAHVAARFRVLEDAQQQQLLEQLRLAVLLDAAGQPDGAGGRALAVAITAASDLAFKDALSEAIKNRGLIEAFLAEAGGTERISAALSRLFGIEPDLTLERLEAEIVDGPYLPRSSWAAVADTFCTGSNRDCEQGSRLRRGQQCIRKRAGRRLSVLVCDQRRSAAQIADHVVACAQASGARFAPRARAREGAGAANPAARGRGARAYGGAAHHRGRGYPALPGREGAAWPTRLR